MITKTYSNKNLNISFTCPEGWTLYSHQQGNVADLEKDIYQKFDEEMPKQHLQSLCVLNLEKYKVDNPHVIDMQLKVCVYKMNEPYLLNPETNEFELLGGENYYVPIAYGGLWYLKWRVTKEVSHNIRLYPFHKDYFLYFIASNFNEKFKKELWEINALVMNDIFESISEETKDIKDPWH